MRESGSSIGCSSLGHSSLHWHVAIVLLELLGGRLSPLVLKVLKELSQFVCQMIKGRSG